MKRDIAGVACVGVLLCAAAHADEPLSMWNGAPCPALLSALFWQHGGADPEVTRRARKAVYAVQQPLSTRLAPGGRAVQLGPLARCDSPVEKMYGQIQIAFTPTVSRTHGRDAKDRWIWRWVPKERLVRLGDGLPDTGGVLEIVFAVEDTTIFMPNVGGDHDMDYFVEGRLVQARPLLLRVYRTLGEAPLREVRLRSEP